MIELGSLVKDRVSGKIGIAVARNEWMNGCVRYGIAGKVSKEGKVPETEWVDEQQIIVIKPKRTESKKTGGGMRQDPQY